MGLIRRGRSLAFIGEALLVLAGYAAYSLVRVLVEGTRTDAVNNAYEIIALEKSLGIFYEVQIQQAFADLPGLLTAMEGAYRFTYLPAIIVIACAGYVRDRQLYARYRSAFFLSLAVGLMFFALLPVAPPRLLPEYGFVDIVHGSDITNSDGARNNFAAVPSFHFGLPLLMTIGFCQAFRLQPWQIAMSAVLPGVMLLAIISTANHFFLDAATGAAVVMFSVWWCVWRSRDGSPDHAPAAALE